ncbi:hypothetical protein J7T55_009716 [Diaporthe amygdali]|uniref:uncharacterized protein n=1 Tax=Phomopsis amygdali TaxID=1214568 RepID=UPI0022FED249|nr:uncharacterized protein J7T55_009716 [Diaporthe amygdali]KAJ0104051.1 hypothetical protein J7T55_009716 [Diaporthe amygdali]
MNILEDHFQLTTCVITAISVTHPYNETPSPGVRVITAQLGEQSCRLCRGGAHIQNEEIAKVGSGIARPPVTKRDDSEVSQDERHVEVEGDKAEDDKPEAAEPTTSPFL